MTRAATLVAVAAMVLLAGCSGVLPVDSDSAERRATVTNVVDGDTVHVRFADGSTDTVRLLGIDAPETRGELSPGEFGLPDDEATRNCLRAAADDATAYARSRLADREVVVTTDSVAERRGDYGRLLAYVRTPGANTSFNRALLAAGHARVYVSDFTRLSAFEAAVDRARTDDRGLWRCGQ